METLDLDTLRGVDEHVAYRRTVEARISELEREHPGEAFPESLRDEYSTLIENRREVDNRIQELRARESYVRTIAQDPRNVESEEIAMALSAREPRDTRASVELGLRALDRHRNALSGDAGRRLETVVRSGDPLGIGSRYLDAVGDPSYHSAFGKMVSDPTTGHLRFSPTETEAVRRVGAVMAERAMSEGTTTAGGFAIPFTLDPSILLSSTGALNPVRSLARVITVATRDWKGVSSDGVTAAYAAEATEATDNSPTLAQPAIQTQTGKAFVPFSIELGQDWGSLQDELLTLIRDGRDVLDATMFLTGNGTNQPTGILNIGTGGLSTTQRVQTTTVATFALGDPWLLKAQLPARFVNNVTFAAAPATWDTTYRFVGGNSTEPLQMPTRDGNFLGRPKVEWSTMGTGTTTGTKLIIGGDFRTGYTIVDRIGMTAELIPHLFGPTSRFPMGQRGIYAYWRTGAAVVVQNAFRYLEVK